ncbi:MAG: response regulator [Pseudomonadota bacterium]|nr:response regulator [Pseudomonadota bacterium]
MVETKQPDLVILDCSMPGIGGVDVLRRLRVSGTSFAVPVLMLTARSSWDDEEIALRAGADDYLRKPFSTQPSWSLSSTICCTKPSARGRPPPGLSVREALSLSPRYAAGILALALVYFATAAVSIASFGTNTPIWFANALAIAWLLQQSGARQPVCIAAIFVADLLAVHLVGSGPAALLALADITEIALATWSIRKIGGPAAALSSISGLVHFIVICLAVPILSSAFGAAALTWSEGAPFLAGMQQWYGATALGMLIVCPVLLIWLTPELRPRLGKSDAQHIGMLTALLAGVALYVFSAASSAWLFVLFPALLLLVWSSGLAGASVGSALLVIIGLAETLGGSGAIVRLVFPLDDIVSQIQGLQLFLAALALSSMPLAVVLTDQQRLALELSRVAEARSEFLAAMSHEIRTPMTGVLGIVDLLEMERPTPKQRRYIESIRVSGRHLLNIINDVLDFSRIETGKIQLESVDFSLPVLLEQLHVLLDPMARERDIALSYVLPPGSPPVLKGDPTRLKQVLLNLAGNAIKFTSEGRVTLEVSHTVQGEDGNFRFRFEVQDTGIGIPPDKLAGLFSAFTQADNSTKRRFGGSGLGLAISKRLVVAMGGDIGARSAPGKGSLFWFEVPLLEGDAVRMSAGTAQTSKPIVPRRLLLADDVELNRDIIRTMLERDGHEVVVANDGLEAVNLASQSRFDLVLMDIHMPVMDGIEATRLIRDLDSGNSAMPILALTANVMVTEQQKCIEAGMNGVLMKPVEWDRLRSAIDQFGGQRAGAELDSSPTEASAEHEEIPFGEDVFARVRQLLPEAQLQAHVEALEASVGALRIAGSTDLQSLEAIAHKVVSQAGMLGLFRLSARSARIEQSCRAGHGVRRALERFREASSDVRDYLRPGELARSADRAVGRAQAARGAGRRPR